MDANALRDWLAALDRVSYYELFGLPRLASHDEVRAAFHSFSASFHPDVHRARPPEERAAIGAIYRRGTEAYRVLLDPSLRERYDAGLADGVLRSEDLLVEPTSGHPGASFGSGPMSRRLVDLVRAPGARPFVVRAEELARAGDPKQAKLQMVMAMHLDPGNPALEAYARTLEDALSGKPR